MKAKFVYQSLREGVADKYASANFGITDPDEEFELQWAGQQLSGHALTWIHGYPLIKNPKSLEHFVPNARAVILSNGDLYVISDALHIIHVKMLGRMKELDIIDEKATGWEDPFERNPDQFIAVQRVWNKNAFALSESYVIPKRKKGEPASPERLDALRLFFPFLKAAAHKFPQYQFVPEQIMAASREMLSDLELQRQKQYKAGL